MGASKKILIVYASAGHGHEKASRAVWQAYGEVDPLANLRIEDSLDWTLPFFGRSYGSVYLFLIKHAPWLWGIFYECFDWKGIDALIRPLRRMVNTVIAGRFQRFLIQEQFEVVICTHFMAVEVVSALKRQKKINSRLITVITDYLPHAFWITSVVDGYAVGLPETKAELIRRGVAEERIKILGIPVERKFNSLHDRPSLMKKWGLQDSHFTVLLSSGGAGVGDVDVMATQLLFSAQTIQVIVICGTNQFLFNRLSQKAKLNSRLLVLGFVNNMEEFMEMADVIIGKAGGLTLTESLVKTKPMILFQSLPGQEMRNASCMKQHEASLIANSLTQAVALTMGLSRSTAQREVLKCQIASIRKPEAAHQIAQWAMSYGS